MEAINQPRENILTDQKDVRVMAEFSLIGQGEIDDLLKKMG